MSSTRGAVRITLGLFCAAIAQVIALFMAGAGHGWITPFWFSIPLWVLLPPAFALSDRRLGYSSRRRKILGALAILGLVLDVALVWATMNEGTEYFWTVLDSAVPFPLAWIALFVSWQVAVAATLIAGPPENLE